MRERDARSTHPRRRPARVSRAALCAAAALAGALLGGCATAPEPAPAPAPAPKPGVGDASAAQTPSDAPGTSAPAAAVPFAQPPKAAAWPPPPVPAMPHITQRKPGAGQWSPIPAFVQQNPGAPPLMYQAFIESQKQKTKLGKPELSPFGPYMVWLATWDPEQVELQVVAGVNTPRPDAPDRKRGPGTIPRDAAALDRLIGAFNGGWKTEDAPHSGMMMDRALIRSPGEGRATAMVYDDGRLELGTFPKGGALPSDARSFRQNLEPVFVDGVFNPAKRTRWGGTGGVQGSDGVYTVRSALCRTRDGFPVYIWGAHLADFQVAEIMERVGCVYGMHLDMNGAWAAFELYRITQIKQYTGADGRPAGPLRFQHQGAKLGPEMSSEFPRYIGRYPKDYFYLLRSAVLPSAPLDKLTFRALPQPGSARRHPAAVVVQDADAPDLRALLWHTRRFRPATASPADAERGGGLQLLLAPGTPAPASAAAFDPASGALVPVADAPSAAVRGAWVSLDQPPPPSAPAKLLAVTRGPGLLYLDAPNTHALSRGLTLARRLGAARALVLPSDAALHVRTRAPSSAASPDAWLIADAFAQQGLPIDDLAAAPAGSLVFGLPAERPAFGDLSVAPASPRPARTPQTK